MKFADYPVDELLRTNIGKLGWKRPTDIQYKAIPVILQGSDLLAVAQTGTGKTAAYVIPALHMLREWSVRKQHLLRCLVMVPTHELALQTVGVFELLGRQMGFRSVSLYGGADQDVQIEKLKQGVDIAVATPGRLFDLRHQGHLRLDQIRLLVLDEADRMLEYGFLADIRAIVKFLPKQRQTLFFSATIDREIKKIAYTLVSKPVRIELSPKDPVTRQVDHAVLLVSMDDKRFFLERVARQWADTKMMVFVRTRIRGERVQKALKRVEIDALLLHGGLAQADREVLLRQFSQLPAGILIATDVLGRGIDMPGIDMVVNYDLPEDAAWYVHRVGRTGRGDRRGRAISFCSPEEKPLLEAIESWLGQPLAVIGLPDDARQQIVLSSLDRTSDMKSLLEEIEVLEDRKRRREKRIK